MFLSDSKAVAFFKDLKYSHRYFCTRHWSHIATHLVDIIIFLVVLVFVRAISSKKPKAPSLVLNCRIGMRFVMTVLQVNNTNDWRSTISNMTPKFQDGRIWLHFAQKVLPSGECVCPAHNMWQLVISRCWHLTSFNSSSSWTASTWVVRYFFSLCH